LSFSSSQPPAISSVSGAFATIERRLRIIRRALQGAINRVQLQ
jgi:hypothetical protein